MRFNHVKKQSDTIISATQPKLKKYVILCHQTQLFLQLILL